nr:hypothetical protein [Frigoribacterium sp. PvP032]
MLLQARPDAAGHARVRHDAVVGPAGTRADREQRVRRLRLGVGEPGLVAAPPEEQVVEDDGRPAVAARRDGDHAGAAGRGEGAVQSEREGEVAEVVRRELEFPARRRVRLGGVHHPRVRDQDVERAGELGRDGFDRGRSVEVQLDHVGHRPAGGAGDVVGDRTPRCDVAHGERHPGAGPGQGAGRLDPDARGGARHQGRPPAQVDALECLGRSRPRPEGADVACRHVVPLARCRDPTPGRRHFWPAAPDRHGSDKTTRSPTSSCRHRDGSPGRRPARSMLGAAPAQQSRPPRRKDLSCRSTSPARPPS